MHLLKLSLTITLLGILILLLISNLQEPKEIKINQITEKHLDKQVKIQGEITYIRNINPDFQIITIKDSTKKIDILVNTNLNLKTNQKLLVTGKVQEYKSQLQIQADKIILF